MTKSDLITILKSEHDITKSAVWGRPTDLQFKFMLFGDAPQIYSLNLDNK